MAQRTIKNLFSPAAIADASEGGQTPVDITGMKGEVDAVMMAANTAGSSPTLNLKLQSSPVASISHSYEQEETEIDVQLRIAADNSVLLAASFTQAATGTVKSVFLPLKERGTLSDGTNLTLTIEADNAGDPSGTALATATVPLSSLTGDYVNYEFAFDVDLSAGDYWLVLASDYTASATNNVAWQGDSGLTSGGNQSVEDGTNWAADADDSQVFTMYQYVFTDVTDGAYTEVTTGGSAQRLAVNVDNLGSIARVHATVTGSSTPSYRVGVSLIGFDEDS